MAIECPNCGAHIKVRGLGRKRLNIPLKNVYESLQSCGSVSAAAVELNCSEGYIFNTVKAGGLKVKDVLGKDE